MNNRELYSKAIDRWGKYSQLTVAMEELSELIKEICKYERGLGSLDNLAEEIADVEIMCEQLRMIFDCDEAVQLWKDNKLLRLEDRLD